MRRRARSLTSNSASADRNTAVITAANAAKLKCRILAEGANGPTTPEADIILNERRNELFVIPDILANSGGAVVSYFEWVQDLQGLFWSEAEVNSQLEKLLGSSFNQVLQRSRREAIPDRTAAMSIGVEKVRNGKECAGFSRSFAAAATSPDCGGDDRHQPVDV